MGLGIAFSIKGNLGTLPISCVPYILSLGLPLTVGTFTVILHTILVFLQILILRKDFEPVQLFQILIGFIFGYFVDLNLWIISGVNPTGYILQWLTLILGCVILAFGVFIEVKSDTFVVPADGFVLAISKVKGREFGKVKPYFDVSMTVIGIIISFILLGELAGVREGTVFAAIVNGYIVVFFRRLLDSRFTKFLN